MVAAAGFEEICLGRLVAVEGHCRDTATLDLLTEPPSCSKIRLV